MKKKVNGKNRIYLLRAVTEIPRETGRNWICGQNRTSPSFHVTTQLSIIILKVNIPDMTNAISRCYYEKYCIGLWLRRTEIRMQENLNIKLRISNFILFLGNEQVYFCFYLLCVWLCMVLGLCTTQYSQHFSPVLLNI